MSTAFAAVDVIPLLDDSKFLPVEYPNGANTAPLVELLKSIGDVGSCVLLEPNVVVPKICPTTGLKSNASDNSYVPSGSRLPKSTLVGEYVGMS